MGKIPPVFLLLFVLGKHCYCDVSTVNWESISQTGHSSPCICTLKRLAVSSHYYSFFFLLYNSEKGPSAFMAKSIWLIQGNVSRIQKLKKRKKQPDYSFPWKVSSDMGSQKCKINLCNIRCTEPNLSWLYVSVLTPFFSFVYEIYGFLINSTQLDSICSSSRDFCFAFTVSGHSL